MCIIIATPDKDAVKCMQPGWASLMMFFSPEFPSVQLFYYGVATYVISRVYFAIYAYVDICIAEGMTNPWTIIIWLLPTKMDASPSCQLFMVGMSMLFVCAHENYPRCSPFLGLAPFIPIELWLQNCQVMFASEKIGTSRNDPLSKPPTLKPNLIGLV